MNSGYSRCSNIIFLCDPDIWIIWELSVGMVHVTITICQIAEGDLHSINYQFFFTVNFRLIGASFVLFDCSTVNNVDSSPHDKFDLQPRYFWDRSLFMRWWGIWGGPGQKKYGFKGGVWGGTLKIITLKCCMMVSKIVQNLYQNA